MCDGCVELVDTGYCEMQKAGLLHDSEEAVRGAKETNEATKFAFGKMNISVSERPLLRILRT
eukprot:NODE_15230_length_227_cov_1.122093.p3 GENE.NODE_15230_length_227_cov_1.122093~~NODE_15230_length_227_cov_1.122093.p3  ORF type:complete len:62 (+),score=19.19 NODE_15230_length_227_cov_1.122093:40-225(+)